MAHFAEIDKNNKVIRVLVGDNNDPAGDEGLSWLETNLGGTWVKTSYNTRGNVHYGDDGKPDNEAPFRGNYAGVDFTYDSKLDVFYAPQPYPSWTLDEKTYLWNPPTPYPNDEKLYVWVEADLNWQLIDLTPPTA